MRVTPNGYVRVEGLEEIEDMAVQLRHAARVVSAQTPMPAVWRELFTRAAELDARVSTYYQISSYLPVDQWAAAKSTLYALISAEEKAALDAIKAAV